ncbi:hypothetical protein O1611_g325 [Lasiodiplodia mahajangana]|uniref:Uncharacterized protein n=1 Tax=Lasiodiplodia mahajangana TaxID=1108764 RepID=A0ACC2K0J1_9PEZI|nr:hypothetical protein O1611_g325 [Lasiodiplodia mahajangana]
MRLAYKKKNRERNVNSDVGFNTALPRNIAGAPAVGIGAGVVKLPVGVTIVDELVVNGGVVNGAVVDGAVVGGDVDSVELVDSEVLLGVEVVDELDGIDITLVSVVGGAPGIVDPSVALDTWLWPPLGTEVTGLELQ